MPPFSLRSPARFPALDFQRNKTFGSGYKMFESGYYAEIILYKALFLNYKQQCVRDSSQESPILTNL